MDTSPRPGTIARPLAALTVAVAVGLAGGPARAGAKLAIDYVEGKDYIEKGTITLYVDLLDDNFNVIGNLDGERVSVVLDDQEVPGTLSVQTAEQAGEWVAVAILMAAHRSYASWSVADIEEGGQREPDIFKYEQDGFANFSRKLSGNDKIAVWTYFEKGLRAVLPWTDGDSTRAPDAIESKDSRPGVDDSEKADVIAPPFFKSVKEVLGEIGKAENLPRRQLLLVMSDGKDQTPRSARKKVDDLTKEARDLGVKVYAVGFTLDVRDGLIHLAELASGSGGIYREVKDEDMQDIPQILENIAVELKKQYVITFTPHEDWTGSEKPVKVSLKAQTPDGQIVEDEYEERVKVGEKAFDWKALLVWTGVGLGGLLFVFLVWKVVAMVLRARRDVPAAVQEESYQGPYKGRLAATGGPHVGQEFFITEDVTTIGSIPGNTIVLQDPGISKRHAGIKVEEMRFELADFGSTNGTFVNGSKITKQFLRDGDEIRMGESVLRFTLK